MFSLSHPPISPLFRNFINSIVSYSEKEYRINSKETLPTPKKGDGVEGL